MVPPGTVLTNQAIWEQQRQRLVQRLASKGIHVDEDDPRLNHVPLVAFNRDNSLSTNGNASDSESGPPHYPTHLPMSKGPDRAGSLDIADKSLLENSLQIGRDPILEASRQQQLKEVTRQQLQKQMSEKQSRVERDRIEERIASLPKMQEKRAISLLSTLTRVSSKGAIPFIDPVVEKQHRKDMQAEISNALQQQIHEKAIKERTDFTDVFSTSTSRAPFASNVTPLLPQRLLSSTSRDSQATPLSLVALDRDPKQENSRRMKSQADLNSFLRLQMEEQRKRKSLERMGFQKQYGSLLCSDDKFDSEHFPSSSDPRNESVPSPIVLVGESAHTPQFCRQKQRDYAEALQQQIRERRKISFGDAEDRLHETSIADQPSRTAFPIGEKDEAPDVARQKRKEYADALQHQMRERSRHSSDQFMKSRSKSLSCYDAILPIGEIAATPEIIREKHRDYAEALQQQMLERSKSQMGSPSVQRGTSPFATQLDSDHTSAFAFGEKSETPEVIRQQRKAYADALQLQMRERQERKHQERQRTGERKDSSQSGWVTPIPSWTPSRGQQPTDRHAQWTDLEGIPLKDSTPTLSRNAAADNAFSPTANIFNYDPAEAALAQKLRRRQLGEDLQKQIREQRKREEEHKVRVEQENLEYENRILKQIEESQGVNKKNKIPTPERNQSNTDDKPSAEKPRSVSPVSVRSEDKHSRRPPVKASDHERKSVDWAQTEAEFFQPLRHLRDQLAFDSDKLRARIMEQRQMLATESKPESEDLCQSLPNISSWLPVDSDLESRISVKSELLDFAEPVPHLDQVLPDKDIVDRFESESPQPFPRFSFNQQKRRSKWGSPVYPMPTPLDGFVESG